MFDIAEELKKLPDRSGVYLMHGEKDEVIYVGKAVNLKNRVRQYFQDSRNKSAKIQVMVSKITRFEYIVTDSEMEALVLECNLIKTYRPKYNTMLMDDRSYPYIEVTREAFPRVRLARKREHNTSLYFGPYTSVQAVRDTIELLRTLFKIRDCNRALPECQGKARPCLNYDIGKCTAPCIGEVSEETYAIQIDKAVRFLKGDYGEILSELAKNMYAASEEMAFERAIEYREKIKAVKLIAEKQKMSSGDMKDRDVLALARQGTGAVVQVFFIRSGRMIGRDHFYLKISESEKESDILEAFLKQFYAGSPYIPSEILLKEKIPEADLLENWLTEKRGGRVHIRVPQRGQKEKLMELAETNAQMVLKKDADRLKQENAKTLGAVRALEEKLNLSLIIRMEAFDISHISGYDAVGSMVVYEKGRPKKNDYRKFRIRGAAGADDYKSMEQVLYRRFTHGLKEMEKGKKEGGFVKFPDIILMDGGKGQVHVAEKVLKDLNLQIPVCGMVKDDYHRTRGLYYRDVEIPLGHESAAFQLITRIQDEAHRFAITYHRNERRHRQVHSILEDIPEIGPARRKMLMKNFENLEEIRSAEVATLAALPGMNQKAAESVYRFFRGEGQKDE